MSEFIDDVRHAIIARLGELQPAFDEYRRLAGALAAIDGAMDATLDQAVPLVRELSGSSGLSGPPFSRSAAVGGERAAGSATGAAVPVVPAPDAFAARRGPGRPRGGGRRSLQTLAAIRHQPGMSVAELARRIGATESSIYHVLPGLREEGKVVKQGQGWHPVRVQSTPA